MPRWRIALAAVVAVTAALFASWGADKQRAQTAWAARPGTTAAVLVRQAGHPAVEREIAQDNPLDRCAGDKRNVRAFEYHVAPDPLTGPLRRMFHRPTVDSITVVCLDAEAKVTSTHLRIF